MTLRLSVLPAISALLMLTGAAEAQRPAARRQVPPPVLRQRGVQPESVAPGRARLEAEVRRNFARLVRDQVGLSDAQMQRLVPITQRFEGQRRQLQMDEMEARRSLRQAMFNEQTADAKQVDQWLQTLVVDVPKRRAQLLESEQRELAEFMTPFQRAKYMAIQDQIRRRLEQMRQRRVP